MRASIIIPCYNCATHILGTLQSLAKQSHTSIEVIIINDQSTDISKQLIQEFLKDKKSWFLHDNPRKGVQNARNLGLKLASGSFIKFLDSDDLISSDLIKNQVNALIENPQSVVRSRWARFTESTNNCKIESSEIDIGYNQPEEFLADLWASSQMYPLHSWMFPTQILREHNLCWNDLLTQNQDGEFVAKIIAKSKNVLITRGVAYYRNPGDSNISIARNEGTFLSQIMVLDSYRNICNQFKNPARLLESYNTQVARCAYSSACHQHGLAHLSDMLTRFCPYQKINFNFPNILMRCISKIFGVRSTLILRSRIFRLQLILSRR